MELQYIVLTIIKILISVPAVVLFFAPEVHSAALIGGHANNNTGKNVSGSNFDFKIDLSDENAQGIADNATDVSSSSEEIPDPSALIVGGYNLPDNIFNRGKPFYLEKDPLTGSVDFESRAPSLKLYDDYDYEQESRVIYDKSSIDRKDGPATSGSHKPSDINQLTPNFHDFLNLPVKYNPEKYVYPLISSSYANTKVQGNVNNKHNNHKNYVVTTYKPHLNPTYYTTKKQFGGMNNKILEFTTSTTTTTTQAPVTTTTMKIPETTSVYKENLMNSPMNHPSFGEEFYLTTTSSSTSSTTTKRTMSLFEQLFGSDYDDQTTETTERTFPSSTSATLNLFNNLPNKYSKDDKSKNEESNKVNTIKIEDEYDYTEYTDKITTMDTTTTTTSAPTIRAYQKVTSLPLGENHLHNNNNNVNNRQPIIVSSENLRDRLNNEKVKFGPIRHQVPSTSNIHIAPDQDTVSFVVGNQQSVDGGEYIGTAVKERPYDGGNFRPVYDLPDRSGGSSFTIKPIKNAEASLTIGAPVQSIKIKPGQVVDDNLDYEYEKGAKIVFPDERQTTHPPDLSPPPPPPPKEVLKLSSKPMFHQLPSDLTPPNEKEPPRLMQRVRPPWDPRPGHFHSGRPEYARPPRPAPDAFKRIDNLPNILPQFRPNMNNQHHHHHPPPHYYPPKSFPRQPLLERPSNRPIGFFEKLHPPPPPQVLKRNNKEDTKKIEDRIGTSNIQEPFAYLQAPPKVIVANRRSGDDPETLQMIQAKKEANKTNTEKPLYVVYPVNSGPLKLDTVENEKKETVVIGTRAEVPLPPSKIPPVLEEFNFELKERNDAPILKPRPISFPIKSDFPYPLERPDPTVFNREPENNRLPDEPTFGSNQWNTIEDTESRIINNQISATLKTYTDKPIAVAYTPTESHFSMPNYASLVIPEIRPGSTDGSEFTVSAVMHARPQVPPSIPQLSQKQDRIDEEAATMPQQDFQAPFQASANIDHSISQGWSIVRTKEERKDEPTTMTAATTSEFDIENFKPQLEGGFKPIYSYPDDKKEGAVINERQE